MSNRILHILLLVLASIPFSIINFSAYLKGSMPSLYQALASILFILLWFGYGLFMSYRGKRTFLKLATLYWSIGLAWFTIGHLTNLALFMLPAVFLFPGPIYGIRYFLDIPADFILAALSIGIVYAAGIGGYLIGKGLRKTA